MKTIENKFKPEELISRPAFYIGYIIGISIPKLGELILESPKIVGELVYRGIEKFYHKNLKNY